MKFTLCDDTQSDINSLVTIINAYSKVNNLPVSLETYNDPDALLNRIKFAPEDYKVFFLDIVMQEKNGIDLAAKIRKVRNDAIIVFTTSSKEFAIDAFGVKAFDYLLKPLNQNKVFKCIENILKEITVTPQSVCQIKTNEHSTEVVNIKDIAYIESLNRRIVFHLKDGEEVTSTSLRTKFLESIPFEYQKHNFINCHASFIVNMNYIKSFNDKSFVMKDDFPVPISKKMLNQVKKTYIKFLVGD